MKRPSLRPRHKWLAAAGIAAAVTGCGPGDPDAHLESGSAPIVAGAVTTGDPAIVEFLSLLSPTRAGICTATLVSPRVLLTAAHCMAEHPEAVNGVFFGASNAQLTSATFIPVEKAIYNPGYSIDNPALEHDLGVLVLAEPAPMKPIPMNRAALGADVVGQLARYVGYGLSDGVARTGAGIKREASKPIAEVRRTFIRVAPNANGACNGDSGGPLLLKVGGTERLIGVVSFGDDEQCLQSSYFQRLDTQIAWVDEQIAKHDPDAPAPPPPPAPPPVVIAAAAPDAGVAPEAAPPPVMPSMPEPPATPSPPPAPTEPPPVAAADAGVGSDAIVAVEPVVPSPAPAVPGDRVVTDDGGTRPGVLAPGASAVAGNTLPAEPDVSPTNLTSTGCGCDVGQSGSSTSPAAPLGLLAGLGLILRRRAGRRSPAARGER